MSNALKFYINGAWVDPVTPATLDVINPATEEPYAKISVGSSADVDRAVAAARAAFPAFSQSSKAERLKLLRRILEIYNERAEDIARAVSDEMGAPMSWARDAQTWAGRAHLEATIAALESFEFEHQRGGTRIVQEGIGVVGLITPWNWPLNQIVCKVAPAIAAGCTMVLKPSEIAPIERHRLLRDRRMPRACRRASTTWSMATGPRSARSSPAIPASTWSPSPARHAPASSSPRRPPTR